MVRITALAGGRLRNGTAATLPIPPQLFLFTDGVLTTLFHQDPRYFRKGAGSTRSRIWWALRSEGIAFSDDGNEIPNYSSLIGFGMSTALSNAYSPSSSVTFASTMVRYGVKVDVSFGLNLLREFGGISRPEKHQPSAVTHF
jgi:hypothetical protein